MDSDGTPGLLKLRKVFPRIWDVGQDQIMQGNLINWHEGKRERHEISCPVTTTLPRSYHTSSTRKGRGKLAGRWGVSDGVGMT